MINSPITFPTPTPALKLARPSAEKWAATLAEERRRLQEDHESLREREANLRDYETRLRVLQAEIEASRPPVVVPASATPSLFQRTASQMPFLDDPALHAAWEKLHRARELFETEQSHLREDRVVIHDQMESLKRKEAALVEREAKIAEREALIVAAMPETDESEHTRSAISRLTTAPFQMAREMFSRKKPD